METLIENIVDVIEGGPEQLVVAMSGDAVVASGFGSVERICGMLSGGGAAGNQDRWHMQELPEVRQIWARYLQGDLAALDEIAVRQRASPVQSAVWDELRRVPPGRPITYGDLASAIGRPRAARAVGSACAANRIAPFIPCHRVVATGGGLGGYGYGLSLKRWLLDHESSPVA